MNFILTQLILMIDIKNDIYLISSHYYLLYELYISWSRILNIGFPKYLKFFHFI